MAVGKGTLSRRDRRAVEAAVAEAEAATGLQLCVYLGRAEGNSRTRAEELFVAQGLLSRPGVLILVAPKDHRVEVVTGPAVKERVPDEAAAAAVTAMTERFAHDDLAGGIQAGVRHLAAVAGPGLAAPAGEQLPDVLDG